ncbi:MAG: ECF transporter S component [Clostridia bacterium]|nr:ECF transporter S component [Clostridia bacterium]
MNKFTLKQFVTLAVMVGVLLLMSYTPLGYMNIGPLAISFNMIPVAIAAMATGPIGGAIAGATFGLTSFLQCIGVGGTSAMGAIFFSISPWLAFVQRFIPRLLDGLLLGYLWRFFRKHMPTYFACAFTGFCAAFLNTLFFMTALVVLFGHTEYVQGLINGRNVIVFVCAFVGINAVVEMVAAWVITGAVGTALTKARLIKNK